VTTFFPKPAVPDPKPPTREPSPKEKVERAVSIIQEATSHFGEASDEKQVGLEPWVRYVSYGAIDGLPKYARMLFQAASETCGTSLEELTRAVQILENKMVAWGSERAKAEREGQAPVQGASVTV
jgi:hypothetical protein